MAVKGERMPPELVARMRAARAATQQRNKEKLSRKLSRNGLPPPVEDEVEDVSLPTSQPAMTEPAEEAPPPVVGDPADPYNLWLMVLDADTRALFSPAELRELWKEKQAQAAVERKVRRKKEIGELALSTARSDMGLLPAQKVEAMRVAQQNAKRVSILVELPPAQDNGAPADVGLRVNGNVIENGRRHFCTYGEAASLREMLYRAGQHELQFKGQNLRYRAYLLGQAMGTVNTQIDAGRGSGG